jgi:hypothetical protein
MYGQVFIVLAHPHEGRAYVVSAFGSALHADAKMEIWNAHHDDGVAEVIAVWIVNGGIHLAPDERTC